MTLLAIAGNASRSKNWLIDLAPPMMSEHFLFSGLYVEVFAPLAVMRFDVSTEK